VRAPSECRRNRKESQDAESQERTKGDEGGTHQAREKLHWKGGDHTMLEVAKNRSGQHRWKTNATTEQLIRDLARLLPDGSIASILNRLGMRTASGAEGRPVILR
jgi:hypothetical protein